MATMKEWFWGGVYSFGMVVSGNAAMAADDKDLPQLLMETSKGSLVLELYPKKAPKTVANFLAYVDEGFYDGTIFHRIIKSFMNQGGGFTSDFAQKKARPPIVIEADNGLKNTRGSIAMARTSDPNSATAQFFINTVDNDFLNHREKTAQGWGYTVFGKVVSGMSVMDDIAALRTGAAGPFPQDVPLEMVVIKSIKRKPPAGP